MVITVNDPGRKKDIAVASETVRDILVIAVAVLLAITAYSGTLTHELVWDDVGIVKYIDSIIQEGGLSALVTSQFATHIEEGYVSGYYRPIPLISLWLDSALVDFFPYIYHLTNILLHALVTALVFVVLRLLSVRSAAAVGSMLFAVHPIHSESVSFVSGRTDLWAAVFVLLAMVTWIRERDGSSTAPARDRFYSLVAFFMACLSKEVALILPAVLLVWDAVMPGIRQGGETSWWSRNRRWILGWAAVLAAVMVLRFLVFGPGVGLIQARPGPESPGESATSLILTIQIVMGYLRLLVLPWPLRVYYGPGELQITWLVILGVGLFLCLVLLTFFRIRKEHAIRGTVWIIFFLLPVLVVGARGGALLAERFLYLPSVGICLMAGVLAAGLDLDRRAVKLGVGLLVALMITGTIKQNVVWKNEITLFSELVRVSPLTTGGFYNLGNAYSARGLHIDSIDAYRHVLEADSRHYRAHFNMGNAMKALGRYEEAEEAYRLALLIKPDLVAGYANLGLTLLEMEKYSESAAIYREGILRAPGDIRLHLGLIYTYTRAGDMTAAQDHYRTLASEDRAMAEIIGTLLEDAGEDW